MTWVIIGLGNPGEEYEGTRHNLGRMAVRSFAGKHRLEPWKEHAASKSQVARGAVGKEMVVCVLPDTFMNKSGYAATRFVKSVKAAEKCIVVYDELDLPFGEMKIAFDRGSGGHKGIDSIARSLKTRAFMRIRVGISHGSGDGRTKPARGDVERYILGSFTPREKAELPLLYEKVDVAIEAILGEGRDIAMNRVNTR